MKWNQEIFANKEQIMRRWIRFCALMLLLTASAAADENANSIKTMAYYLTQHGYGAARVDFGAYDRQNIKVEVNGSDVYLLIDMGFKTCLTKHCAHALKLDIHDSGQKAWWQGGESTENLGLVPVNNVTINAYPINRTNTIFVLPKSLSVSAFGDGIFGYDFLHFNSAILPVGLPVMFFKPGNSPVANVDHFMSDLGLKPIPISYGEQGLKIKGRLNGHPFTALLDSNLDDSQFNTDFVKAAGQEVYPTHIDTLTLQEAPQSLISQIKGDPPPDETRAELLTDQDVRIEYFRFKPNSLDFGPLTIDPDEMLASKTPLMGHVGCDLILGRDFMATHHAIIDLGRNTLWMQ